MRLKSISCLLILSISIYVVINLTTLVETGGTDSFLVSTPDSFSTKKIRDNYNILHKDDDETYLGSSLGFRVYSNDPNDNNIDKIRIVGERHSGTSFLTRYLKSCFPSRSVDDYLLVGKHWFQPTPEYVVTKINKENVDFDDFDDITKTRWQIIAKADDPTSVFNDTLVLAIFRDPYDWIEGMRRRPHHWPNHADLLPRNKSTLSELDYNKQKEIGKRRRRKTRRKLSRRVRRERRRQQQQQQKQQLLLEHNDVRNSNRSSRTLVGSIIQKSFVTAKILYWEEFIKRPLTLDHSYHERDTTTTTTTGQRRLCQKGFEFGSIIPCKAFSYVPEQLRHIPKSFLRNLPFEADEAVYELNNAGTADVNDDDDIINGGKRRMGSIKPPFQNPLELRRAKIMNVLGLSRYWNFGAFAAVRYEDILGNNVTNLVKEIENILKVKSDCPKLEPFRKRKYSISADFNSWITNHCDWTIERKIGYTPTEAMEPN